MSDRCPTCGVPVIVHTADEGTGYYEPASVALYEAVKRERDEALHGCSRLIDERESAREGEDTFKAERDLAIAHDRQPYPTAEAYEKVCAARTKWQQRAEEAEIALHALDPETYPSPEQTA